MELESVRAITAGGEGLALATIIQVQGSSPRHPGSTLLLTAAGARLGTVGGGRGEALALEACARCLETRASALLQVAMVGNDIGGADMVCGGTSTLLIEHLAEAAPYRLALERLDQGERMLLVKRIQGPAQGPVTVATALFDGDGALVWGEAQAGASARRTLDRGRPHFDPEAGVFQDPLCPQEKLLILGAGHVGQALAALAPALGFAVTVVDDRSEFLAPGRFPPEVRTLSCGFGPAIAAFPFDAATYAVVVTRGHQLDLECVRALLARTWRYAGFMGSARKTRLMLDQLLQDGWDPARVAALWAPIGLDLAGETPQELAVAILGELVAVRRNAGILPSLRSALAARRA
jgi:xanthine dehydrogenase accessory factor